MKDRIMRSKRTIGIAVIFIIVVGTAIIAYIRTYNRTFERSDEEDMAILTDSQDDFERSDEEYIAILTGNQEDFDYVAQTLRQWDEGYISFCDEYGRFLDFDDILIKNQEIESEISNNEDFYKSLHNLYDLGEVDSILISRNCIEFDFSKPPRGFALSGFIYREKANPHPYVQIDEHWELKIFPSI